MAPLRSPGTETKFEEVFLSRDGLGGFTEKAVVGEESFTSRRKFLADGTLWKLLEIDRNYLKRRVQRAGNLNLKQIEKVIMDNPEKQKSWRIERATAFAFYKVKKTNEGRSIEKCHVTLTFWTSSSLGKTTSTTSAGSRF